MECFETIADRNVNTVKPRNNAFQGTDVKKNCFKWEIVISGTRKIIKVAVMCILLFILKKEKKRVKCLLIDVFFFYYNNNLMVDVYL